MTHAKYKITIIEPSPIVATGLSKMIGDCADFTIANFFTNLQTYNDFQNGNTDIIIVNPAVATINGHSDPKAMIPAHEGTVFVAISYGPYDEETFRHYDGYISIYFTQAQIEKRLLSAIRNSSEKEQTDNSNELSSREREILTAVAKGKTNKEIADEFNLSVHTVISHRKNISHKLGINSISGLTIYAVMNKLVDIEDF